MRRTTVCLLLASPVLVTGCSVSGAPGYRWDLGVIGAYLPLLLQGLVLTLFLTVATMVAGLAVGTLVAAARLSRFRLLRLFVAGYIELMRGTPALVQLVWVYYCVPILFGIQLPAIPAVVLALTLNVAAYYGEAFRSGIQAVPREQVETAEVLGLSYAGRMRFVVLPQAIRTVLPVLISTSIALFKDTSLVSTLGVADLMYNGQIAATQTYRPIEVLSAVALIYFAVAFPTSIALRGLELRLSRHRVKQMTS
jgi:polar amino acid transport system permease protein